MIYQPLIPSRTTRREQSRLTVNSLNTILGLQLNFKTWMLLGASVQTLFVYVLTSQKYLLLLPTVFLGLQAAKTYLQYFRVLKNPYLENAIMGRSTALMPNKETGEIEQGAARKIVVFHLGAKSNSPLGFFDPQLSKVGDWLTKMSKMLDSGDTPGFLGQSQFYRLGDNGALETVLLSYWESIEDIWAFAHSGAHKEAWQWWEKTIKQNDWIGLNHELFEADAKSWENVYLNFQPTMMGETIYLKKGNKLVGGQIADEWISPLVSAKRGPLAKSSGRMGRGVSVHDGARVAKETYDN